jgi:hypothetical protein
VTWHAPLFAVLNEFGEDIIGESHAGALTAPADIDVVELTVPDVLRELLRRDLEELRRLSAGIQRRAHG